MDWEKVKAGLVEKAIMILLSTAVGILLANGWNGTIATDVAEIKRAVTEIKTSEKRHDDFMNCTKLRIYAIENGIKRPPVCAGSGDVEQ